MRILLTGAHGQIGWELRRALRPLGDIVACGRAQADLSKLHTLAPLVQTVQPDVIVNAAAYTAVDQAESEEALAMRVNAEAVGVLAEAARRHNALMIHYSTDYVFDGASSAPYVETDATAPLNIYGRSKLAGEKALQAAGGDWLILRTTWIYAPRGRNFLRTMLRLATERETLRVVADQTGAPTSARMMADVTAHVLAQAQRERAAGRFESDLFHLTASGQTTWHGFAAAIIAAAAGRMPVKTTSIEPITSDAYPTPARRPHYSVLDNSKFEQRFMLKRASWQEGLELALEEGWPSL